MTLEIVTDNGNKDKKTRIIIKERTMNQHYHYINPFVVSSINIIKETTGLKVQKKNVFIRRGKTSIGGVGIILDIHGDLRGKVVFEFSRGMTMRLASRMLERSMIDFQNPEDFKKLLESAIIELGNLVSGKAITILEEKSINCNITPPSIFFGKGVSLISDVDKTIVIEMKTIFGDFMINLAIEKTEKKSKSAHHAA